MADLTTFNFNSTDLRVVELDGNPWFVAADIRRVLELTQYGNYLKNLGDDEKTVIRKSGNSTFKGHGLAAVSESGLYKLVLRSTKPQARTFQDWVTKTVLPAIRKDGGYIAGEENIDDDELLFA